MNIYDNNKQLLDVLGGKSQNLSTDFEVRKAILELLGGNSNSCNSIYDIDLQILKIYQDGGGNIPESGGNCEELEARVEELNGVISLLQQEVDLLEGEKNMVFAELEQKNEQINSVTNLTITENGVYTPPTDVLGYNLITVDVAGGGNAGGGEKVKVKTITFDNDSVDENGTINLVSMLDTSNVKDMSSMFSYCNSLTQVDVSGFDTSKVTTINNMFYYCNSLQTLDLSNFDTSKVTNIGLMFTGCKNLTTLIGGRTIDEVLSNNISALNGLTKTIDLTGTILDRASLRALINGLADLTGSTSQTVTLGSTLIAKLTEEDIAVATAKNWTIS